LWVQANKRALEAAYPWAGKVQKGKEGAWIFAAPAELVSPYACGDVIRTKRLFDYMRPHVEKLGMLPAYDRERELMPILMENERDGMRLDIGILEDIEKYEKAFKYSEDWLRRELGASGLNFDADVDTAAILIQRGVVPEHTFARTAPSKGHPNGVLSMSKDNLFPDMFTGEGRYGATGKQIASALGYRNRLKTCLDMFMKPWADQAEINLGRITTNWNQIRSFEGGGTRTGRPSTNKHNFLNVSKSFDGRDDQYEHPEFLQLPTLPLCRTYILPDEGEIFCHRDFNGQELRVFGHFEQGDLWEQYQANPSLDVHAFVGAEMELVAGRTLERTRVKTLNFQGIYGGGVPALQNKLRISIQEAKELKVFHNKALPGRIILNEEIKRVIARGGTISTWGGRLYVEEPRGADGRSKVYKLINYLIQGSAADLTKQAIIDWHKHPDRTARFLVTVYDEINISAPIDRAARQMAVLRETMEMPRISVPMLSDGKIGYSWGKVIKYNDNEPNFKELVA
jgi:DNA polymerase I-like protein with 3'-5' exonuclease and polymerase domains